MNNARNNIAAFGIQTAAIGAGGYNAGYKNQVESWNGTSWTNLPSYPLSKQGMAGTGIQTSGLVFGGGSPYTNASNTWTSEVATAVAKTLTTS